ncbi:MAG TPA: hypothetical protein VFR28_11910 [Allosphingosinicella sp.]|jgi:hypothetical protein|nr:hypothetical protein [Allosphingosinicella sp.]
MKIRATNLPARPPESLDAKDLAAQLNYRGRGNPANSHPVSAISNCFPGLEFDFRTAWRRMFEDIQLSEHNNYVVSAAEAAKDLKGRRLLLIEDEEGKFATAVLTVGVQNPGLGDGTLSTGANPEGVSFMEWSNSLARVWRSQGKTVTGWFTADKSDTERLPPKETDGLHRAELKVRSFFDSNAEGERLPSLNPALLDPGDLSEGLCSPWQNDYRECACYYWAASRPDYVNVVDTPEGITTGEHWLSKEPSDSYVPDDRADPRLWSYDDLFQDWQGRLRFIIGGTDEQDRRERDEPD